MVWYFRELARRVGAARMASEVRRLRYGNADTSGGGGVDRFWLSGTLAISADEQVEFLRRFHAGKLGFDPRFTAAVEHAIVLERGDGYVWSGKTGGCKAAGGKFIGWLVGYVERGRDVAIYAGNVEGSTFDEVAAARTRRIRDELEQLGYLPRSSAAAAARCSPALSAGTVCEAANAEALRLLAARRLSGATVVEDVRSGAVVAYASSSAPGGHAGGTAAATLDVGSPILPLSIATLFLAASWWDHETQSAAPAREAGERTSSVDVHEMIVSGSDSAGRRLALALRRSAGTETVLADLKRYGFPAKDAKPSAGGARFWGEIDAGLRERLGPAAAYVSLPRRASDGDWAEAFSLGETGFTVTLLQLSRFMQAIGNGGTVVPPIARIIHAPAVPATPDRKPSIPPQQRIMRDSTARRLQLAMLDTVRRGTAAGIRDRLGGRWSIGGKTGSGPETARPYDGCFAGLVFDPAGIPRYTVATYIRAGGRGGGAAAEVSADLARFILGL